jgi:chromosome segregation ATPase
MGIDAMAKSKYARSDFNIRIDGDNPDSLLSNNMKELRLDQLNRKINFLFFIMFSLVCILSAAAYFEIKGRTSDKSTEKDVKIEKTLDDMASGYSVLSDKMTQMEKSVSTQFAALEKSAARLNSDLTQIKKNLNLLSSSKTGKYELKQIIAKIDKSAAPYQEKIQEIASQIKQSDKNFKQELFLLADALDKYKTKNFEISKTVARNSEQLTGFNQTVDGYQKNLDEIQKTTLQQQDNLIKTVEVFEEEKNNWAKLSKLIIQKNNQPVELPDKIKRDIEAVNQLQTELLTLTKSVVFKKTFDSALARNQKKYQQSLDGMERNLRTKITALQKEFLRFEKKMSSSIIAPKSDSSRTTKRKQTSDKNSGTIFEMDIQ